MNAKKYIALICTAAVAVTGIRIGVSADASEERSGETIKILPMMVEEKNLFLQLKIKIKIIAIQIVFKNQNNNQQFLKF